MRGLIAVAALVAVIAAVVLLGTTASGGPSKGGASGPTNVVAVGTGTTTTATDAAPVFPAKIVLECAEPTTMDAKTKDGKQEVLHVKEISDGTTIKFLEVDNGFIDRCNLNSDKAEPGKLPGRASYVFDAPRKDTYYIYLRAKWRDNCGNSAWVKIDDGQWFNLEDEEGQQGEKNYAWAWHPLMVGGAAKGYELSVGPHTLWFNVREDGPKLHQWLISTEAQKPSGPNPVKKIPSVPVEK